VLKPSNHHLDALQAEDAKRFRPAPVVADAHAEHAVEHTPRRKAEVAGLEIALFEMLVTAVRIEFVVTGEMHFAVLADDHPRLVHQDRRVEMMPVGREFRIAEAHGHGDALCLLEQRPGGGARHVALEPDVRFAAVLGVPARKEGGQSQLWKDDEIATFSLPHEIEHAGNHGLARVRLLDRAELGSGHLDVAHGCASLVS
jgi:hypothetical protein